MDGPRDPALRPDGWFAPRVPDGRDDCDGRALVVGTDSPSDRLLPHRPRSTGRRLRTPISCFTSRNDAR